jgi:hypothetical protein
MSVSLLRLHDGRIALFYLRKNSDKDCRPIVRFSSDEAASWSEPVLCLEEPLGYYCVHNSRVIQLPSGRLLIPCSCHNVADNDQPEGPGYLVCCWSDDGGATWTTGSSPLRSFTAEGKRIALQEPGLLPLKDGRLLMYARTNAGSQYFCYSTDEGETWTQPTPSALAAPLSPATLKRLPNGDIVAIWNNKANTWRGLPLRVPLTMAISKDEAQTWLHVKNLEASQAGWFCYTGAIVVGDNLLLAYNCKTRALLNARITTVPLSWLYEDNPAYQNVVSSGVFDTLPKGDFQRIEGAGGVWTVRSGGAAVIESDGSGLWLKGGENAILELELSNPLKLNELDWIAYERYSKRAPYTFFIDAKHNGQWVPVAQFDDTTRTGLRQLPIYTLADQPVSALRFRCTSHSGVVLRDPAQKATVSGFFMDCP